MTKKKTIRARKKRHTTKNQIIIDENTTRIINVHNERGKVHDYQMLKDSDIIDILNELGIGGKFDSGYQGVQKELDKVKIPYKKSKYHELTEEEKEYNKALASERIKIEHTNRTIKIFRIMKETYRNHMNRYEKRLRIICCLYNQNL